MIAPVLVMDIKFEKQTNKHVQIRTAGQNITLVEFYLHWPHYAFLPFLPINTWITGTRHKSCTVSNALASLGLCSQYHTVSLVPHEDEGRKMSAKMGDKEREKQT